MNEGHLMSSKLKVLNLYAGIGGNRKLWKDIDVTAIENNEEIAKIYQDFFPKDKVIVRDAHKYLEKYFEDFDFIWSSPPCPSHSMLRKGFSVNVGAKPIYPDMKLYEEILFLQGYFKGQWIIENVKSWYEPLIKPKELQRHYFWSNFHITDVNVENDKIGLTGGRNQTEEEQIIKLEKAHGINIRKYSGIDKRRTMRNCVNPELGKHILECARAKMENRHIDAEQPDLFV